MKQEERNKKEVEKMQFTNLNKDIPSPMFGNGFVIGWSSEVFGNDSVELEFRLPIGAIRRLIHSYFNDIYDIESSWVQTQTVGSCEMRENEYAYNIINYLKEKLIENKIDGNKIVDDIFEKNFKEKYIQLDKERLENMTEEERNEMKNRDPNDPPF